MAEAAKVIRLSGYGEQQLRDAIQSGMLTADAARAYKHVLAECKRLRGENRDLKMRLRVFERSRAQERRCKIEAYRTVLAKEAEHQQARDWRFATAFGLMAVGGIVTALITTLAMVMV